MSPKAFKAASPPQTPRAHDENRSPSGFTSDVHADAPWPGLPGHGFVGIEVWTKRGALIDWFP